MGLSYALWKWKGRPSISAGLCYLLLNEGAEIPEVERIEPESYKDELRANITAGYSRGGDVLVSFDVVPEGILVEAAFSTPLEVIERLVRLAREEGFTFFDPQSDAVTPKDTRECRRRMKAMLAEQEQEDARNEFIAIETRARAGNLRALVDLGNRFAFGDGVAKDHAAAFKCYEEAGRRGSCDGMFNLAACYRLGEGTAQNVNEAIRWYELAMKHDKIFAPYALGEVYAQGQGVDKDPELAIKYFTIARENGNQDAVPQLRALGALPPLPKL